MKRIFLTSGIILCMACPAFADLTAPIEDHENGIVAGTEQNPVDPSCRVETLEGYSGTSTFTAQWTAVYKQITISSNIGTSTATGGVSTLTPGVLYTVPGTSLVWTGKDANDNLLGGTNNNGIGENGLVLTNSPMVTEGATATYELQANKPANSLVDPTMTGVVASTPNRPFLGVYDSGTGTNQYIDANGNLTGTGAAAASDNNSNETTWYAKYGSVIPTITNSPSLAGYTFQGWSTTANGSAMTSEELAAYAITQDTELFAVWSTVNYDITFNCARPQKNALIPGQPTGGNTYAETATGQLSNNPSAKTIAMDGSVNITEACTLQGWTFEGWNCTSGLTSGDPETATTFIAANSLSGTGLAVKLRTANDVACTAVWSQNNIGLTWKDGTTASGGNTMSVTTASQSCDYDGGITLPTAPNRPGYTFNGWAVESSNPAN